MALNVYHSGWWLVVGGWWLVVGGRWSIGRATAQPQESARIRHRPTERINHSDHV
jgi:hypothetical protein